MQTLSFRPTTTANGAPPGAQKATLDLQPSAHKARPSSATVQQQRSGPAQVNAHLAPELPDTCCNVFQYFNDIAFLEGICIWHATQQNCGNCSSAVMLAP